MYAYHVIIHDEHHESIQAATNDNGVMPRTARISQDQIIAAATDITDRKGLPALTMQRIGQALGVEAMALYRYFPSKNALLGAIADSLIGQIAAPGTFGDWESATRARMQAVRDLAHAHPDLFRMTLDRVPHSRTEAMLVETFVAMMREAGLDGSTALSVFRLISDYAIGFALAELRGFVLVPGQSTLDPAALPGATYPEITQLAPQLSRTDPDAEFAFGVDLILTGVRALIDQGTATDASSEADAPAPS